VNGNGPWSGGSGGLTPTWRITRTRNHIGEWTIRVDVVWFRTTLAVEFGR
jgi:hypothetical protein